MADILGLYGDDYLDRFGGRMLPSHRRALRDLQHCRTILMGGQLYRCDSCGREHYTYHSCRNRSCPKCHGRDTEAWLNDRREELLPVPYFHVVFTVPQELRDLFRQNQKTLYPLLLRAAAKSLTTLAADPHHVGGRIGVMAILHTWSRTLTYHPHVHCLVPAGGLADGGQWIASRENFLVPVKALSKLFRGRFLSFVAKAMGDSAVPPSAARRPWVVYCKPTVHGVEHVLSYLGRYVHRVAISNQRIVSVAGGQVTFRYRKVDQTHWRTMTLAAHEFIRRFLQHVLPKGLHKIRYYGLWSPSHRQRLHQLQRDLRPESRELPMAPADETPALDADDPPACRTPTTSPRQARPCPACHTGRLILLRRLPRQASRPP